MGMNEDQKRQEVEAKEELEHMIENNHKEIKQLIASYEDKLISSNQSIAKETESNKNYRDLLTGQLNAMSAALDKFKETILTENESIRDAINSSLEDSEKKFGLQEEMIQNSVVNYQEQLEGRIRELSEETKLNSKSLFEIEPLAKSMDNRILTLQNSNAERLEVLKEQILIENTRHIESIKTEVSTSLVSVKEKNESVEKHIQIFKDTGNQLKNEIRVLISKEQEEHQKKVSQLFLENQSSVNEFLDKLNQQINTISKNQIQNEEGLSILKDEAISITGRLVDLEKSDGTQNAILSRLDDQDKNIESKMSSLESADIFLQEASRMNTEKLLNIENECKRMEQTFLDFFKDQRHELDSRVKTDIDPLQSENKNSKEAVDKLQKKLFDMESGLQVMQDKNKKSSDEWITEYKTTVAKLEKENSNRFKDLENTVIMYYQKIGENSDRIKDIKDSSDECNKALTDMKDEMNRNKSMQNDFQTNLDQARELFDQKIVKESERIDKLEATISSTKEYLNTKLGEADKTLSILVEERMKLIENAMEKSENVNEKNVQSLVDKFSNLEEDFAKKLQSISEYNKSITNSIEKNETREKKLDDSMNAIMEQANATLINDAQQDAKIKLLESQNKSLEDKLTSLEAADLF